MTKLNRVDPRIRFIRGYRKKLRPGVEVALKHARDIVARIPGPFALDTETWRTEPLVNAAFARADELPAVVSRSVEVREFSSGALEHPLQSALLCSACSGKSAGSSVRS